MLADALEKVRQFHQHFGFPQGAKLNPSPSLKPVAKSFEKLLQTIPVQRNLVPLLRIHLITEELIELIHGLADADAIQVLDALANLLYVILGTAVTFDLPLSEAFEAVHVSNMTKSLEEDCPDYPSKGLEYQEPDLVSLLRRKAKE